jgi:hypothetical protein
MYFAGVGMMTNLKRHTAVNNVTQPSSSAKADDPVFQSAYERTEKPQLTGCPAFAGHDDSLFVDAS